jgi:hypothetical protein
MSPAGHSYFHRGGENPLLGSTITGKLQKFKMREAMLKELPKSRISENLVRGACW